MNTLAITTLAAYFVLGGLAYSYGSIRSKAPKAEQVLQERSAKLVQQQQEERAAQVPADEPVHVDLACLGAAGKDTARLLSRLPVNYVKIDGALMQGLANDRPLQEKVKALVDLAREHGVTTIAERVEDANTMAVLWQLGIEFIQGYFVNTPEQVTIG